MKVEFFVTCLVDHYFAAAAADAVRLPRRLGCDVGFLPQQSCCGQPAHNAGAKREAARMARRSAQVFRHADAVVVPSGSCAAMVKKHYPHLERDARGRTSPLGTFSLSSMATRTWELSEFIVRRLGVTRLGDGLAGRRVALHQGCHALRELGLAEEPRTLLEGCGARVVPWEASDECCGFGGLFSVKMPEVSGAMADRKLDTLPQVDWVISGDGGCLLQLDGRGRALGRGVEFVHLATALWRGAGRGVRDRPSEIG